jgi:hypothetical protein
VVSEVIFAIGRAKAGTPPPRVAIFLGQNGRHPMLDVVDFRHELVRRVGTIVHDCNGDALDVGRFIPEIGNTE